MSEVLPELALQEHVPEPDEFALALFEADRLCRDFEMAFEQNPHGDEIGHHPPSPARLANVLYELKDGLQRQIYHGRLTADQAGRMVDALRHLVMDLRIDFKEVRPIIGNMLAALSELAGTARYRGILQKHAGEIERLRTFWKTRAITQGIVNLEKHAQGPRQNAAEVAWDLPSAVDAMHQVMLSPALDEMDEAELAAMVGKAAILIEHEAAQKPSGPHPALAEAVVIYLQELLEREKIFLLPLAQRILKALGRHEWPEPLQTQLAGLERLVKYTEADEEGRVVMASERVQEELFGTEQRPQKPHVLDLFFSGNVEAISSQEMPSLLYHVEHLTRSAKPELLSGLLELLLRLQSREWPLPLSVSLQRVIFSLRFTLLKQQVQHQLHEARETRQSLDRIVEEGIDPYDWLKSTEHGPN